MVSEELKAIIDLLNKQGQMDFFDAATEEQISQFEKENKFSLPSRFKEWLLFSDGGECFLSARAQFYGVMHTPLLM